MSVHPTHWLISTQRVALDPDHPAQHREAPLLEPQRPPRQPRHDDLPYHLQRAPLPLLLAPPRLGRAQPRPGHPPPPARDAPRGGPHRDLLEEPASPRHRRDAYAP